MKTIFLRFVAAALVVATSLFAADETRPPRNESDLRFWLENMLWHHHYSLDEMQEVLGLSIPEIQAALKRFDISPKNKPIRVSNAPLLVLPYPGGRHPRMGFLDGAVNPQRETKLSLFTPWDPTSYVVLDVPEAIWSNLGLTYLAHTHIPTIWSKKDVALPRLEWNRRPDGSFDFERSLPNGIVFGVNARPAPDHVALRLWLTNGTAQPLSDLRVQMCAMLKGARGFDSQTNSNKIFKPPFAACRDASGQRWIIHAWQPIHRTWGNAPCPCLHADPKLPDTLPGRVSEARGWLSFYEGDNVDAEFSRIAPKLNFNNR